MIRHEGKRIFVRYDGTETRVHIHRAEEGKSLTKKELAKLVDVLTGALAERRRFDGDGPKPAEGAEEGRYAVLVDQKGAPHFVNFGLDLTMHVSDRDAMEYERARVMVGRKASDAPVRLVRVLDDGAHEAAVEAAAERGRIEALTSIRDACEFKADTVHDGPAMGLRMAMVLVDNAFKRLGEEKGQAK